MSERSRPSIFWFLAAAVIPVMTASVDLRIRNGDRIPSTGAFVFAPNHYSEIDPIITGWTLWRAGRAPRFLAKASLFSVPVLGSILRGSGQIPVERSGSVRGSEPLKTAKALVDEGRSVIIYPEGTLTRDPELWPMRGKTGAVRMALQYGLPVVPVAHWGAQQLMGRYSKRITLFRRKRVDVIVGDPVDLSAFRGRSLDSATLNEASAVVMAAITALLEELRGEAAPEKRWNPSEHNQKGTGRFESEQ
ncbi:MULTISPECIES: lysophospholipid acyltransferase family protein [unclassified Rathayibacter]|uniref:lysophospholipid acyltransferase family protein n=2 Tax=Rathayibacter TaxID=33886 RepID=UPI001FC9B475|nr:MULTISPECIES: lysophospholipid acyltransferase family protein [unclassified Rathayibacter]